MTETYLAAKHQRFVQELGIREKLPAIRLETVVEACEALSCLEAKSDELLSLNTWDMLRALDELQTWKQQTQAEASRQFESKMQRFLNKIFPSPVPPREISLFAVDRVTQAVGSKLGDRTQEELQLEYRDFMAWRQVFGGKPPEELSKEHFWAPQKPFNVFIDRRQDRPPSASEAVPRPSTSKKRTGAKPSVSKQRSFVDVCEDPARSCAGEDPRMGPTEKQAVNPERDDRRSGGRRTSSATCQRDTTRGDVLSSDCQAAPHCRRWKRHAGLPREKQLEYLFLYAAHEQCVQCLQFYAPRVNVACRSGGQDARAWASADGTKAVSQELEELFVTWNL